MNNNDKIQLNAAIAYGLVYGEEIKIEKSKNKTLVVSFSGGRTSAYSELVNRIKDLEKQLDNH